MEIRTASQQQIVRQRGSYRAFVIACIRARWPRGGVADWTPRGTVAAFVLRSNWVAQCPDCPEVMVVEPREPFFCPNCLNAGNGGRTRRVVFPRERAAIERLLLKRPDPGTRNWLVGETPAMLAAENAAHGIKEE